MNTFLKFFSSLKVFIKFVVPFTTDAKIGIELLFVSGVNKNNGIIKIAYQAAQNGPIALMCS